MKKLLMSMVALTVMSSAAFAGSGEKASAEKSVNTTNAHKEAVGKNYAKVTEVVKETKVGNAMVQRCQYTLKVYNAQGQYQFSHVVNTVVGNEEGGFPTCENFFARMRRTFSLVYDIH